MPDSPDSPPSTGILSGRLLVVAFEGWNDAGDAASGAVHTLKDLLDLESIVNRKLELRLIQGFFARGDALLFGGIALAGDFITKPFRFVLRSLCAS